MTTILGNFVAAFLFMIGLILTGIPALNGHPIAIVLFLAVLFLGLYFLEKLSKA